MIAEASIVAPLYFELGDWQAVRKTLRTGNLLGTRTSATNSRLISEVVNRLATLSYAELLTVVVDPTPAKKALLWVAFCRRYELVGEFAANVIREHYLLGNLALTSGDFDKFWEEKARWHEELDKVQPSTRKRLRSSLFLALRQAGILTNDGQIESPQLPPQVVELLSKHQPSDLRFFPVGRVPLQ
jgi:hypothetical protein